MNNPHKDKLIKTIEQMGQIHSVWSVFCDFLECSAISIANSVDKGTNWSTREKQYLVIINKYTPEEQKRFPEMLVNLVEALQHEIMCHNVPTDVLGEIFHELELHNKYKGQFFTPQYVCNMMGAITFGNYESALNENGYIHLCEPACGSGAMVLGFAKAMFDKKLSYNTQLVVKATDIDIKCVHMCYIQLSLYGIPAVVVHGNSLTLEEWSHWLTPIYIVGNWIHKTKNVKSLNISEKEEDKIKCQQK
jgi:Type I restriction-modification system methyltransferase subunit